MNVILRELDIGNDVRWSMWGTAAVIVPVAEKNIIKLNIDITSDVSGAIGGYVIFENDDPTNLGAPTRPNNSLGVQITNIEAVSEPPNTRTVITLATDLAAAATNSEKFYISNWNHDYRGRPGIGYGEELNIDRYVESISYTTDIRYGYYSATIRLSKSYAPIVKILAGTSMNYDVSIYNDDNCLVWNGLIIGSNMTGLGGELFCVGYYYTNQWIYADGLYIEADPDVTAPNVISDLLKMNPYINLLTNITGLVSDEDYPATIASLNPYVSDNTNDGTVHSNQYDANGIGPLDFISTPTLVSDAINGILKLGNYPVDSSELMLQVWDDRIPLLFRAKRRPEFAFVRWIIGKNNIDNQYEGVGVEASLENIITARSTVYVGTDGETEYTVGSYRSPEYTWLGPRMNFLSSGQLNQNVAQSVMREATDDVLWLSKPGTITVSGSVQCGFGPFRSDCSMMRGGDTIYIALDRPNLYPPENLTNAGMLVRIGQTNYDSQTRTNTLTLYGPGDSIEQQITVLRL